MSDDHDHDHDHHHVHVAQSQALVTVISKAAPKFIGFRNRDSGGQEYVALDRIVRICPCLHPEHAGFALLVLDLHEPPVNDLPERLMYVEADVMLDDFIEALSEALET